MKIVSRESKVKGVMKEFGLTVVPRTMKERIRRMCSHIVNLRNSLDLKIDAERYYRQRIKELEDELLRLERLLRDE